MAFEFFDKAKEVMKKLENTQQENIHKAALLISESIRSGGILQAFGSGHSYAGAIEVCGRAGGLIPSKVVRDHSEGIFESVEGNAYYLMRQVDVQPELNVDNMGRFMILEDTLVQLTADDPVKTMRFNLPGSKIGSVRYNGSGTSALTDQGVYIIWSAYVMGNPNVAATTAVGPAVNSRLCFTDD